MPSPTATAELGSRRGGRIALAVLVVGMLAMWGYVLYLAIGPGRQPPVDRLEDPAFALAAEARCAEAHGAVDQLPTANQTDDPAARAAIVHDANATYARMLDDLDDLVVDGGEDGEITREWLADWRTYLADREAFADALETDAGARLLVSPKDGDHVTEFIDQFAKDNQMPACGTPLDV